VSSLAWIELRRGAGARACRAAARGGTCGRLEQRSGTSTGTSPGAAGTSARATSHGVRYDPYVKPRFTSWLVAVLLLFAATFGLPAARTAPARVVTSIVWVDKSARLKREAPESREVGTAPRLRTHGKVLPVESISRPAALLDTSLFQRPPPSHPLVRS
jgi:hypothetical protein